MRAATVGTGVAVAILGMAVHAGSLGNGFAWDDAFIIESNGPVLAGDVVEAIREPYWPRQFRVEGSGLYRPLVSGSFALEWSVWEGDATGYHAVNVLSHGVVVLLLFLLAALLAGTVPAAVGSGVFALHPVHVEAVANVVGRAELWAAALYLAGCLAFTRLRVSRRRGFRVALVVTVSVCYFLSLLAKEISVTLPLTLVLIGAVWPDSAAPGRGTRSRSVGSAALQTLRAELPCFLLLAAALGAYLLLRLSVLGTLKGEVLAPELIGLSTTSRVFTGLSMWPDYLRLMLLPVELSADYGPAVRFPTLGVDALSLAGLATLAVVLVGSVVAIRRAPLLGMAGLWLVITVLPVSNLLWPAGVLLAERTLYLPSVATALVVADLTRRASRSGHVRSWIVTGIVVALALAGRTVARVPVWHSTETVLASLGRDHPESHVWVRRQASLAMTEGRTGAAIERFERALALVPNHFSLLTEAGQFFSIVGDQPRAERLLMRASEIHPSSPFPYAILGRQRREHDDLDGALAILVAGLRVADPMQPVWDEIETVRALGRNARTPLPPERSDQRR